MSPIISRKFLQNLCISNPDFFFSFSASFDSVGNEEKSSVVDNLQTENVKTEEKTVAADKVFKGEADRRMFVDSLDILPSMVSVCNVVTTRYHLPILFLFFRRFFCAILVV